MHRDKTGRIVTLEEKLTSSKELLQKTNKEALKQWASGAKQIDDIAKRQLQLKKARNEHADAERQKEQSLMDRELREKERFGDPLKLMQSKTVRFGKTDQLYRVLTTQSGQKYIL